MLCYAKVLDVVVVAMPAPHSDGVQIGYFNLSGIADMKVGASHRIASHRIASHRIA